MKTKLLSATFFSFFKTPSPFPAKRSSSHPSLVLTLLLCSVVFPQENRLERGGPVSALRSKPPLFQQYSTAQRLPSEISKSPGIAIDSARLEWMTRYASGLAPSFDVSNAMAVDASGNVFVTGFSTHLPSGGDITTIKYDSTGKQIWLQRYVGNPDGDNAGVAIAVTGSGEAYVAGCVLGTDGSYDWAIIKYSPSGSILWKAGYAGASASADYPSAMMLDSQENLIVTGYGDTELITIKYDPSGKQRWLTRYQSAEGAVGQPKALAVDKSGNVYVTGTAGMAYLTDYVTVKYDADGNTIWLERYDGPANDEDSPTGIAVDDSGNVCVTGYVTTDRSRTFQFGTIKYDARGVQQWMALYGAGQHFDRASDIAVDVAGNFYVAGRSDSAHYGDGVLLKYNPNGTLAWKDRFDAGDYDEFMKVAVDFQNNVIVAGTSRRYPDQNFITVKYSPGGTRQWIARYGDTYSPTALCVDRSGNSYVAGGNQGNDNDYATLKYNPSGVQQWAALYDGIGSTYEYPREMAVDGSGNTYVTGVSRVMSGSAVFTMKYSPAGVLQWVSRYNGPWTYNWPDGIKVDKAGNVYVLATNWLNSGYDFVTLKYDADGKELWAARYLHAPGGDNYAVALDLDQDGNVIVTGSAYEMTGGHIATVKYSPEGEQLWVAQYPIESSFGDTPEAMIVDSQGKVYITGAIRVGCITIKYSSDGEEEWVARYESAPHQYCRADAIALDHQGNVLVTGACALQTTNSDCLTLKYNPLGKLVWAARYDGPKHRNDSGLSIVVDATGTAYVGGNSFDDVHNTLVLIKYAADGSQQWVARPGLSEATDNWMSSVVLDSSANILVNATYAGSLRTTAFSSNGSEGRTAAFVYSGVFALDRRGRMHISGATGTGSQSTMITALFSLPPLTPPIEPPLVSIKSSLSQNFPNPFNGSTIINFTLARTQKSEIRIYDLLGRLVTTLVSGELEQGDHYAEWKTNDAPSGIYFYQLLTSDFTETKKLLLIK